MSMAPRVLVVGDGIQDIYLVANVALANPESFVVPKLLGTRYDLDGGALNVGANLAELGVYTTNFSPIVDTKYRVINHVGSLVSRVDVKTDNKSVGDLGQLAELVATEGIFFDAVVISDYAKGVVTTELINLVGGLGVQVYIDSKRSPAEFVGELLSRGSRQYPTFLPNREEYSEYKSLYDTYPEVVVTMAESGVKLLKFGETQLELPSVATSIASVCGAGDTVTAAVVAARVYGLPWSTSLEFAMKCAAEVCQSPLTAVTRGGYQLLRGLVAGFARSESEG